MEKIKKINWKEIFVIQKATKADEMYPFNFSLFNWKEQGLIFIVSLLCIPFLVFLILRYAVSTSQDDYKEHYAVFLVLLQLILTILCGFLFYYKNQQLFVKSGAVLYFIGNLLPLAGIMVVGLIQMIGRFETNDAWLMLASMWSQIICDMFVIAFAFLGLKQVGGQMVSTFQNDWKRWVVLSLIGIIIMVGMGFVFGLIGDGISSNQSSLNQMINKDSPVYIVNVITLFIFTIIIAPLFEEMIYRYSVFAICSNRWLSIVTSACLFALIHVTQYGDLQNIATYLWAGFFLSYLFNYTNGNITYTWFVHMINNVVAFSAVIVASNS